jgi:hypothetical protein
LGGDYRKTLIFPGFKKKFLVNVAKLRDVAEMFIKSGVKAVADHGMPGIFHRMLLSVPSFIAIACSLKTPPRKSRFSLRTCFLDGMSW